MKAAAGGAGVPEGTRPVHGYLNGLAKSRMIAMTRV
jgi:hypothetical protein